MNNDTILLIGFMGSGKTTIGRLIAGERKIPLIDTDEMIVKREGRSINEIFAAEGEPYFRNLETETLRELLNAPKGSVISVGGGMPVREENRKLMKQIGTVVYLTATVETLMKRLAYDKKRPMLKGADLRTRILDLMEKREALYLDAADICIATDPGTPSETAAAILKKG